MSNEQTEEYLESLDEAARRLLQRLDARKRPAAERAAEIEAGVFGYPSHEGDSLIHPPSGEGESEGNRSRVSTLPGVVINTEPNNILRFASNENRQDGEIPW